MFFKNGLSFECQRCSKCCRHEPGVVFLQKGEGARIASFLNMKTEEFYQLYCRILYSGEGQRVVLKEKYNYDCIFWKESGGCEIYPVRPTQCATYPFWPHILDSPQNWEEESKRCPGIGQGKSVSVEEIHNRLSQMKGEQSDGTDL